MKAILASIALGLALGLGPGTPAGADAPTPTDFFSEVLEVEPGLPDGVTVQVVGGDSFLEVRAEGHQVEVADYDNATIYLRFGADGTVERNRLAVATSANEDRFGAADIEPDPAGNPVWETVSTNGAYAWHDHRIHWMSPRAPTAIDGEGRVDLGGADGQWQVPLTVDGTDVTVTGQLWLRSAPPLWPSIVAAIAVTLGVAILGWRHRQWPTIVGLGVAIAAIGVSAGTAAALPAGLSGSWVPFVVSGLAVVAALLALSTSAAPEMVALIALASTLTGWGIGRLAVLTNAVLPTALMPGLDRAVTVAALATGAAVGVLALLRPPEPPPGDPSDTSRSAVDHRAPEPP